jgi:hypothetical protein
MVSVPTGLLTVPFLENVNKFKNLFRRPVATIVFFNNHFFAKNIKIKIFKFSLKVGCGRYMHVKGFQNLKFLSFLFIF